MGLVSAACVALACCSSSSGTKRTGATNGAGANEGAGANGGVGGRLALSGIGSQGSTETGTLNPDAACVADTRQGQQIPVDLLFMIDTTGSMNCPLGTAGLDCEVDPGPPYAASTRWTEESTALNAFVTASNNAGTGVGIAFFPSADNICDASSYATPDVEIAPLPGNAAALTAAIAAQQPAGSTPTVASLTGAIQHASAWATAHPSRRAAVVYSTDGYPEGCTNNTIAAAASVAQAGFAATPSIATYVLGVGPNLASLNQIAAAGGTTQAFLIDTTGDVATELSAALDTIRTSAITCNYQIPTSLSGPLDYEYVNVDATVGSSGTQVSVSRVAEATACSATTGGWYYDSTTAPTMIVLCPATCTPLMNTAGSSLQVLIGCLSNGGPPVK